MKKMIGLVVALFLLLTAVGCANSQKTDGSGSQQTDSASHVETERAEESQAATDASSDGQSDSNEIEREEIMRISVKSGEYEIIYELNDSPGSVSALCSASPDCGGGTVQQQ